MATLVIVDDSSFMRKMLRDIVTRAGHDVVAEASDGAAGVEAWLRHRPDLTTLDLAMPKMDGEVALATIRSHDPSARIIVCSSQVQDDIIHRCLSAGAVAFIGKPFQAEDVLLTLTRVLG
ncbi:MAG: response regulator [Candidatus Sericytochromatia bacterium]|nr:response regulator [Candidatus Sericytochromatia bacterium]